MTITDHKALVAEARSWIAEPLPARGDVVPAALFVTLVGRLADALESASVARAVVEAQTLEQAAKVAQDRADDLRACHKNDDCDVVAHGAQVVADDLRDRARIMREGQA